jgi:ribonuclease P protein component
MKYSEALKKNEDFKEIYRTGKSYANKYLIMYVNKNNTSCNRIGISVSKKVGNSVIRHRITRLVRESYRLSEDNFMNGLDIIVVARAGAKGKDYSEIQSALLHLMKLHKIGKETSKI